MGRLDFFMSLDLRKLVITLVTLATFAKAANGECCGSLELSLENDASANQGVRAGNYEIQAQTFNGRNIWKRDDGKYVVWFNSDTDYWTIGSSVGSGGGLFAPSEFECPNEAGSQWAYYEVGSANTIIDAGNDVSVKCPDPCPFGYVLNMDQFGSLPDSGQLGYQKYIESIDDCATLCNADQYCCAFEYSDSQKRCYMNVDCNPTRPAYKSYNYCTKEAGKVDCVTISSDKHKPCVFPVLWKGEYHDKCIKQASTGKTWCATELKSSGKYQKFGHCSDSCPREGYPPPPPPIPTSQCFLPEFAEDEFCNDLNNTPECNYDGGACCGDNVKKTHCIACECLGSSCSLDRTEDENIGYGIDNFQPSSRVDPKPKDLTDFTDPFEMKHFLDGQSFGNIKDAFVEGNNKDKQWAIWSFSEVVKRKRGKDANVPTATFMRRRLIDFFQNSLYVGNSDAGHYETIGYVELLEINVNSPAESKFMTSRVAFGVEKDYKKGCKPDFHGTVINHFVGAIPN